LAAAGEAMTTGDAANAAAHATTSIPRFTLTIDFSKRLVRPRQE